MIRQSTWGRDTSLFYEDSMARIILISGKGGVGKTTVAAATALAAAHTAIAPWCYLSIWPIVCQMSSISHAYAITPHTLLTFL